MVHEEFHYITGGGGEILFSNGGILFFDQNIDPLEGGKCVVRGRLVGSMILQ